MKPTVLLAVLFLAAATARAQTTPPDNPPPPVSVHLDAPAGLAPALADALADRSVAVSPGGVPADAAATVRLLPASLLRVRSSSADSPAAETIDMRRASLEIRDSGGRLLHDGAVAAPGSDASVLVLPLADRIAACVQP